eukprot:1799275-Rhodomonas_salina.2
MATLTKGKHAVKVGSVGWVLGGSGVCVFGADSARAARRSTTSGTTTPTSPSSTSQLTLTLPIFLLLCVRVSACVCALALQRQRPSLLLLADACRRVGPETSGYKQRLRSDDPTAPALATQSHWLVRAWKGKSRSCDTHPLSALMCGAHAARDWCPCARAGLTRHVSCVWRAGVGS